MIARCLFPLLLLAIATHSVAAEPTPPEKYEPLIGEGLAGSGFVVSYAGKLWGVCSLHQFDGKSPTRFEQLEGDAIPVAADRGFKQKDVQALLVTAPPTGLAYLAYDDTFELKAGDPVLVITGGKPAAGKLSNVGVIDGYDPGQGPLQLRITMDKPFAAAGTSGTPIVSGKSGQVVGVLLAADDPDAAEVVDFETLCLAPVGKLLAAKPTPFAEYLAPVATGLDGSAFCVRYNDRLWGICSQKPDDPDRVPQVLEPTDGRTIALVTDDAARQNLVLAIPARLTSDVPSFLAYDPDFSLADGDELVVMAPGRTMSAKLSGEGLKQGRYASTEGPRSLRLGGDDPVFVAGGIGSPVMHKRTGNVIGVVTATDGPREWPVTFETLCLTHSRKVRVDLVEILEASLKQLPQIENAELEQLEFEPRQLELAYILLPHASRKPYVDATRRIVGFGGSGGKLGRKSVSFMFLEFNDRKVAAQVPAVLGDAYRQNIGLLRLAGMRISKTDRTEPKVPHADTAVLVRATGVYADDGEAFSNLILRAARGRYVLELILRDVDMTDQQAIDLAATVLEGVGGPTGTTQK